MSDESSLKVVEERLKSDAFAELIDCLKSAGAEMDSHYIQLPVAGENKPRYRERVYCYELYHQLRVILPHDYPYKLNGEVFKGGMPISREGLGRVMPDMIVHYPGKMRNLAVIEVKPANATLEGLRKDIEKLLKFLQFGIIGQ